MYSYSVEFEHIKLENKVAHWRIVEDEKKCELYYCISPDLPRNRYQDGIQEARILLEETPLK